MSLEGYTCLLIWLEIVVVWYNAPTARGDWPMSKKIFQIREKKKREEGDDCSRRCDRYVSDAVALLKRQRYKVKVKT